VVSDGLTLAFKWVNTALGNNNRRYDLAAIIPRLTWAAVRTAPMSYRLLKLAEVCAQPGSILLDLRHRMPLRAASIP
jgi:hypothetical protein